MLYDLCPRLSGARFSGMLHDHEVTYLLYIVLLTASLCTCAVYVALHAQKHRARN